MVLTTDKSIALEITYNVILYKGKSAIKWQYPRSNMPIRSKVSFETNCNFVTGFQCYHIRDKSIVMGQCAVRWHN